MKDISSQLETHLDGEVTSLASCWQITRDDGTEFFFTDHDQDLVIDGNLYVASDGYDRSALKNSTALDTDEMTLGGNLNVDQLAEADLVAGLFDYAQIHFFLVNWQDLSMGIIALRKGWIGEVTWEAGRFTAELRGLSNALQRQISNVYTPDCTADLGDGRCMVDIEALGFDDVIAGVTDNQTLTLTDFDGTDGVLDGGIAEITSGNNAGRKVEISGWTQLGKNLVLFLPLSRPLEVGDTLRVYPGCDKRFATCRDVYANGPNFRGFPHIPGTDALLEAEND